MLNLKVTSHFCQTFSKYFPSPHWRFVLKFQNHLSRLQSHLSTSLCQPWIVSTLSPLCQVVTLSSSHESHWRSHRRNEEGFSRGPSLADSQEAVQAAGIPSHQRGQFISKDYSPWLKTFPPHASAEMYYIVNAAHSLLACDILLAFAHLAISAISRYNSTYWL